MAGATLLAIKDETPKFIERGQADASSSAKCIGISFDAKSKVPTLSHFSTDAESSSVLRIVGMNPLLLGKLQKVTGKTELGLLAFALRSRHP